MNGWSNHSHLSVMHRQLCHFNRRLNHTTPNIKFVVEIWEFSMKNMAMFRIFFFCYSDTVFWMRIFIPSEIFQILKFKIRLQYIKRRFLRCENIWNFVIMGIFKFEVSTDLANLDFKNKPNIVSRVQAGIWTQFLSNNILRSNLRCC